MQVVTPIRLTTRAGIIEATFFLPSVRELHTGVYGKSTKTEELTWEYFRHASLKLDEPDGWRTYCDVDGKAVSYWTRYDGNEDWGIWGIDTDGGPVRYHSTEYGNALIVACSITA